MLTGRSLRVLVVDDHEVVRQGLRSFLHHPDQIEVVGEAGTADEALAQVGRTAPDVVVMDVRLPDRSGVEACREIRSRHPQVKVLMLTSYSDDEALMASIVAGASGYVLKHTRGSDLAKAIEVVANGGSLLDLNMVKQAIERLQAQLARCPVGGPDSLTGREREVLRLLAQGKTNREIGRELFISERTVKNCVSSILAKLNLNRRSQVAAYLASKRPAGFQ